MLKTIAMLPILIASSTTNPDTEVYYSVFPHNKGDNIQLVVPFNHQVDDLNEEYTNSAGGTACGPTTLTMLFRYNELNIDVNTVIRELPTNIYVKGVGFYDLKAGAEIFNMQATEIEDTPTAIFEALSKGNPVILNIQNYDASYGHAVVVTGIRGYDGENAKALIIHDPFQGPYRRFEYITEKTLQQPEGPTNYIGHKKPFYITR